MRLMLYMALLGTIVLGHAQTTIGLHLTAHDFTVENTNTRYGREFDRDGDNDVFKNDFTNQGKFIGSISVGHSIGIGGTPNWDDHWNSRGRNWDLTPQIGAFFFFGDEALVVKPSYALQISYTSVRQLLSFSLEGGGFVTFANETYNTPYAKTEVAIWILPTVGLSVGASMFINEKHTQYNLISPPRVTAGLKFKL